MSKMVSDHWMEARDLMDYNQHNKDHWLVSTLTVFKCLFFIHTRLNRKQHNPFFKLFCFYTDYCSYLL